ncbi:hypothetical protein DPSP01_008254 [Paraphaeosphaeria sporulosa]
MRFPPSFALFLFSLVSAQDLGAIPSCVNSCGADFSSNTSCDALDGACICRHANTVWDNISPCVASACSASDIQSFRDFIRSLCAQYGVSVDLPAPASSTSIVDTFSTSISTSSSSSTSISISPVASTKSSATDSSSTPSSATTTSPPTSPSVTFSSTTSSAATTETTSQSGSGGGDSKAPVGAIIGGVIGGLALLCIAGIAVFYIKRRHPRPALAGTPVQDTSVPPKYEHGNAPEVAPEYSTAPELRPEFLNAPEVAQPGQAAPYYAQVASQSAPRPGYGASELGGQTVGGHAAAHELPTVRK